jgi:tetratricopeptide (TPR) repeat protein
MLPLCPERSHGLDLRTRDGATIEESHGHLPARPSGCPIVDLLSAWIEGQLAYRGWPGLSIAVAHQRDVVWSRGFGWADVDGKVEATAETLYRVASITKTLTATAILQLRDAGKLRLDDEVRHHLPWFTPPTAHPDAPPITLLERNIALEGDLRYERFGSVGIQSAWSGAHLADVLSELGRFDEAIGHAEASVQIAEDADNPFTLNFGLFALGRAHLRRGDLPRASQVLERGLELCRTRRIVFWTPSVAAALGVAHALASRADEALPLVAGAVEEFRGRPNHFRPAVIPLYAGMTCLRAGRIDEAAGHAREALALTRRLGARGSEADALCLTGDVAFAAGAEDAEGYYREALALAGELGMRPLVAHCHFGLGKLYRRTGKREQQAREHLATATTMYREMDMRFWLEQAEVAMRVSTRCSPSGG